MFESIALMHQHRIVVVSDDVGLSSTLQRYKKARTEMVILRHGEISTLHQRISCDFDGVICLDTDSRFLSRNFSDFAICWMGSFFPQAKMMLLTSREDEKQKVLPATCLNATIDNDLQHRTPTKLLFINRNIHFSKATLALTPQERLVMGALAQGSSIKEIATRSNRSVKTIYTHKAQALKKLNVHKSEVFSNLLGRFGYQQ